MKMTPGWQFWIDRGGTFTDIVAKSPQGQLTIHKLLSHQRQAYTDAAAQGIREVLGLEAEDPIPLAMIESIKMGTTVATNALLERKGDRTLLVITQGFGDALRIGYQTRPDIFAQQIRLPDVIYDEVLEVKERVDASGQVLQTMDLAAIATDLQAAYHRGFRSCAIVLMHGYRFPAHEQQLATVAQTLGFEQISVSHQVSPLIKLIGRGDTTTVDAYLSPILRQYIQQFIASLGMESLEPPDPSQTSPLSKPPPSKQPQLMFMQSNGGLIAASSFQGKNSILSGPAGGVVGAVRTSAMAGFEQIIGFDMGGTSTDVSHYNGTFERSLDTEIAGVRLQTPMMAIHTVAAGGGSILKFDGDRLRVGPESAGADPGPACYGQDGPLTITDCNVLVGKIQPEYFPAVFGSHRRSPLDTHIVKVRFRALAQTIAQQTGQDLEPEAVAAGFLAIAVENMAHAIKKISLHRGYDLSHYTLACFGGAGGQHACGVAEALGIRRILIHPYAGVLSAYGIGLADVRMEQVLTIRQPLTPQTLTAIAPQIQALEAQTTAALQAKHTQSELQVKTVAMAAIRYGGTDSCLTIHVKRNGEAGVEGWAEAMQRAFESNHQQYYGFVVQDQPLVIESITVEAIGQFPQPEDAPWPSTRETELTAIAQTQFFAQNQWLPAQVFRRSELRPNDTIPGPALIIETTGTTVVEPQWQATVHQTGHLILQMQPSIKMPPAQSQKGAKSQGETEIEPKVASEIDHEIDQTPDPIRLEIFNNLFQSVAEQMGVTLQKTSYSVNIKERLDFSCALFDQVGNLVANAPHIPVHLGSMGESVRAVIETWGNASRRDLGDAMMPGDSFLLNDPYQGGTHLPDITVVTPVFLASAGPPPKIPLFYVASRGHHADLGGITPGSMPAGSTHIQQEGILLEPIRCVRHHQLAEADILQRLQQGPYPARNPRQNLADLRAQVAANTCGLRELEKMTAQYGLATIQQYMGFVQDNAAQAMQQIIPTLKPEHFSYEMDGDRVIQVSIQPNAQKTALRVDFTGTSPQQADNFNAPVAVTKAAVLYVFRCLINDEIPLNEGCLRPIEIVIPQGSMLNPQFPAAVVAGNVEVSQALTNALFGALGILAASQGTMNNLTFGNEKFQYYETICGGAGAGATFPGTSAVQTHMTNSRLTDPEILEDRFPVRLNHFSIRTGSGGAGRFRGGDGVDREIELLEPMTISIVSGHRETCPLGLQGGQAGQRGQNILIRADGSHQRLPGNIQLPLEKGDRLRIKTPGGGGYGVEI